MSVFGSSPILPSTAAASLAGLNQAERANKQNSDAKKVTKPDGRKRAADEVDVQTVQSSDAVRALTANGDEETSEDRQGQDNYNTKKDAPKAAPPRLDVQG